MTLSGNAAETWAIVTMKYQSQGWHSQPSLPLPRHPARGDECHAEGLQPENTPVRGFDVFSSGM